MADVIDFPNSPAKAPIRTGYDQHQRALAYDVHYVVEVLSGALPLELLAQAPGLDLRSVAQSVVMALEVSRSGRAVDPQYDELRLGGEVAALAQMIRVGSMDDAPKPPGPPECA